MSTTDGRWEIREEGGELGQAETARWVGAAVPGGDGDVARRGGRVTGSRLTGGDGEAGGGQRAEEMKLGFIPPPPLRVAYIPAGRGLIVGRQRLVGRRHGLLDGLLAWADFSRVKWATPFFVSCSC
jgi:hypothetical protein